MADSDLTIVILRNIQAEMASFRESFASMQESFALMHQKFDVMTHQLAHLDNRLTSVEEIAIKTANSLGIEAWSSRHRAIRHEGELAELKVRVSALETIVKGKPAL